MWKAILAADLAASPVSKLVLALRGYGALAFQASGETLPERLERFGFTKLREIPSHELVFGLAGRFWRPSGDLRRLTDGAAFDAFAEEGCVKAAWNLRIDETDGRSCDLSTETRIMYFGVAARRKFRLYWALLGPFSSLLRRTLLASVKRGAKQAKG